MPCQAAATRTDRSQIELQPLQQTLQTGKCSMQAMLGCMKVHASIKASKKPLFCGQQEVERGGDLLEGEVEGPEEAGQPAHTGRQALHLRLGQPPPPHLPPKGQARHEAKMLLEHPHIHLTLGLHHHISAAAAAD